VGGVGEESLAPGGTDVDGVKDVGSGVIVVVDEGVRG